MVIQADFSDNANIEFYKGIQRQIVQKDVGFIVLNAGIGTRVPLGECDPKLSQNLLDTNVYHVATLMKLLLPVLENRQNRLFEENRRDAKSGIIVTSSIGPKASTAAGTQYSASKAFCNFLCEAVKYELEKSKSRVELTILSPGPVYTNLTKKDPKVGKCNCIWATPKQCVFKALKDMGREIETMGVVSHDIIGYLSSVVLLHWSTLGFRSQ